jgi:hypothetical protein
VLSAITWFDRALRSAHRAGVIAPTIVSVAVTRRPDYRLRFIR